MPVRGCLGYFNWGGRTRPSYGQHRILGSWTELKGESELSISIHLSASDWGCREINCLTLLAPGLPHHHGLHPQTRSQNQPFLGLVFSYSNTKIIDAQSNKKQCRRSRLWGICVTLGRVSFSIKGFFKWQGCLSLLPLHPAQSPLLSQQFCSWCLFWASWGSPRVSDATNTSAKDSMDKCVSDFNQVPKSLFQTSQ